MAANTNALNQRMTSADGESPGLLENTWLPSATWCEPWKAVADCLLTVLLLVLAAPVLLVCAALVKLTSQGPALYSQTRTGRNGRLYTLYKLRTMRHECERESGACWSVAGDRRITPVGRFLRRTHLDELPQLWNVLRGDMSLVGPRPERPEFFAALEESIPLYRARLLVRPGITGLAQVQQDADSDLDSVRRKLAFDLYYVLRRNPWLDCRLMIATALKVVGVSFGWVGRLLVLPRLKVVEYAYQNLIAEHAAGIDTLPVEIRRSSVRLIPTAALSGLAPVVRSKVCQPASTS
jgi:lipopolysaccharide/colanic/teichoic acid biosynthesis glycosyltransferase